MRSSLVPFALAALVTVLIGVGVAMEPYFAGDVRVARALQAVFPDPGAWATPISRIPTAPAKYYVMVLTLVGAYWLAGWRGLLIAAGALALDQYGGEASKGLFARPRPSRDLIAVAGEPRGFTFPSTTLTFACATFGLLGILSARHKAGPIRTAIVVAAAVMIGLSCAARVVLGAHWPSDVALTTIICLMWLWVVVRAVQPRAV